MTYAVDPINLMAAGRAKLAKGGLVGFAVPCMAAGAFAGRWAGAVMGAAWGYGKAPVYAMQRLRRHGLNERTPS